MAHSFMMTFRASDDAPSKSQVVVHIVFRTGSRWSLRERGQCHLWKVVVFLLTDSERRGPRLSSSSETIVPWWGRNTALNITQVNVFSPISGGARSRQARTGSVSASSEV